MNRELIEKVQRIHYSNKDSRLKRLHEAPLKLEDYIEQNLVEAAQRDESCLTLHSAWLSQAAGIRESDFLEFNQILFVVLSKLKFKPFNPMIAYPYGESTIETLMEHKRISALLLEWNKE